MKNLFFNKYNKKPLIFILFFMFFNTAFSLPKREYDFTKVNLELNIKGNSSITIATLDKRELITSGKHKEDFVGWMRGGYGNPFGVGTTSHKSFAEDVSESIALQFKNGGFDVDKLKLNYTISKEDATEKLVEKETDFSVLLIINDFRTDQKMAWKNTWQDINYDIKVIILNKNGDELADNNVKGDMLKYNEYKIPMSATKYFEQIQNTVQTAYIKIMSELINNKKIIKCFDTTKSKTKQENNIPSADEINKSKSKTKK